MKEVIDQDTITNGGESSQFETKEVLDKEIDINEGTSKRTRKSFYD